MPTAGRTRGLLATPRKKTCVFCGRKFRTRRASTKLCSAACKYDSQLMRYRIWSRNKMQIPQAKQHHKYREVEA